METITLAGFGDFSEDEAGLIDLQNTARAHGVEFYPTYYDHELKGSAKEIEAITQELWSMPRDQWAENNLFESPTEDTTGKN